MTNLDRLADIVAGITPAEWWVTHVFAGEEVVRAGEDPPISLFSIQREEDAAGIVALRNAAEELIEVARAARDFYRITAFIPETHECRDATGRALAALDAKLEAP